VQVSKKIRNKYIKIVNSNDSVKTKHTAEKYIRDIAEKLDTSSPIENRLKAEQIVIWCFYARDNIIIQLKRVFKAAKQKAQVSLARFADCLQFNLAENIDALCGQGRHVATSEAYYAETAYHPLYHHQSVVMNSEGKSINILPLIEMKKKKPNRGFVVVICVRQKIRRLRKT